MATYISSTDITDMLFTESAFSTLLTAKLTASDAAVVDLAERNGVESTDIEVSPVHYILKKWAAAWVCRELALDAMGKNNPDIADIEKYKIKYDIYAKLTAEYEAQVNIAVLTGEVEEARDRSTRTGTLYRG
jgi:hypothetical protein